MVRTLKLILFLSDELKRILTYLSRRIAFERREKKKIYSPKKNKGKYGTYKIIIIKTVMYQTARQCVCGLLEINYRNGSLCACVLLNNSVTTRPNGCDPSTTHRLHEPVRGGESIKVCKEKRNVSDVGFPSTG